jgi:putative phosphoribosyl transferase
VRRLEAVADRVVALEVPSYFQAVGQFYQDFRQVDDAEVREVLASRRGGED